MSATLRERIRPALAGGGFYMPGYFVWCGSMIRVRDRYHLFASRWPAESTFPEGYRTHSEIVRATSDSPLGPFVFEEVVVSGRGGSHWDGKMCHNPKIALVGRRFVLFYIGSAVGSGLRKIGWAVSESVEGPWTRVDAPLDLGEDANNPAPYFFDDGSLILAYRDEKLRMSVARADAFDGTYRVIARDIFPAGRLEDPDLYYNHGRFHMIVEDNEGVLTGSERFGGHLSSADGVVWTPETPVIAYTHTIEFTDGTSFTATRRERPEMFNANATIKGRGEPTHLITGVLHDGRTGCVVQPIAPPDNFVLSRGDRFSD